MRARTDLGLFYSSLFSRAVEVGFRNLGFKVFFKLKISIVRILGFGIFVKPKNLRSEVRILVFFEVFFLFTRVTNLIQQQM